MPRLQHKSPAGQSVWKFKYDETFQQYYYINTSDNTISFDSPCEVRSRHSPTPDQSSFVSYLLRKHKNCSLIHSSKPRLLSRITSAFSKKTSTAEPDFATTDSASSIDATSEDVTSLLSGLNDELLLQPAFNFTHTTAHDSESVVSEIESIHSYYSNISPYDIHEDYRDTDSSSSVSDDELESTYDGMTHERLLINWDKEQERRELRLQFMQEMDV